MDVVERSYAAYDVESFLRCQTTDRFRRLLAMSRAGIDEDPTVGPMIRVIADEAYADPEQPEIVLRKFKNAYYRVVGIYGTVGGWIYDSYSQLALRRPVEGAIDMTGYEADVQLVSRKRPETYTIRMNDLTTRADVEWTSSARWCYDDGAHVWEVIDQVPYHRQTRALKSHPHVRIAFDFETVNDPVTRLTRAVLAALAYDGAPELVEQRACSCAGIHDGLAGSICFHGADCVDQMVHHLTDLMARWPDRQFDVVGFNNATFDNYLLIPSIIRAGRWEMGAPWSGSSLTVAGSKILEVKYANLTIHDVRRYVVGSLATATRSFQCRNVKSCWHHHATQTLFERCVVEVRHRTGLPACPAVDRHELDDDEFAESVRVMFDRMAAVPAMEFMVNDGDRKAPTARAADMVRDRKAYDDACADVAGCCAYHAFVNYCRNDVVSTRELAIKIDDALAAATDDEIHMLDKMTAPQAAAAFMKRVHARLEIRQYKPHSAEEAEFCRSGMLAGMSIIYPEFAPRTLQTRDVLLLDVVSLYPYVAMLCEFATEGPAIRVGELLENELPKNALGMYRARILERAMVPCMPFKPRDHPEEREVTSHCWDFRYEAGEIVCCTSIDLDTFRELGGRFKVLDGFYTPNHRRGIYNEAMGGFKLAKQRQDYYKEHDAADGVKRYVAAMREIAKIMANSITGKFVERVHNEHREILPNNSAMLRFIADHELQPKSERAADGYTVSLLGDLSGDPFDAATEPRVLTYATSYERALLQDRSIKSVLNGCLLYSYARRHLWLGLLGYAYLAGAVFAVETDGVQFDRPIYEAYMARRFPGQNPYWMTAREVTDDGIFDLENPNTIPADCQRLPETIRPKLENLGSVRCRAAAEIWAAAHGQTVPKTVYDLGDGITAERDYGEYSCEAGIDHGRFEAQECCYLAKKFYYLARFGDPNGPKSPKCTAKGFGKGAIDAHALTHDADGQLRASSDAEMAEAMTQAGVLDRAIYERLAAGTPLEILEYRFNCGWHDQRPFLRAAYCLKTLEPPWWTQLRIRSRGMSTVEMATPESRPRMRDGASGVEEVWLGDRMVFSQQTGAEIGIGSLKALLLAGSRSQRVEFAERSYRVTYPTHRFLARHLAAILRSVEPSVNIPSV